MSELNLERPEIQSHLSCAGPKRFAVASIAAVARRRVRLGSTLI